MTSAAGRLFDVVVVGAGPAGTAAALGLATMGFNTALISRGARAGVQGLSARALVSLSEAGLGAAAACASPPATRQVLWAGEHSERGQEALIERASFDDCLRASLQGCALCWMDAAVHDIVFLNELWHIETSRGPVRARALLDARGRFARRSDARGPLLVSWQITLQSGRHMAPRSAVVALDDGWCWLAVTQHGTVSAQVVGSATKRLSRKQLAERIRAAVLAVDAGLEVDSLLVRGTRRACAAVARYSQPSRGQGYLRIGDASVAMDPLSGNGIHEALRSARVAVAAINSYVRGEPWAVVARFVDERSRELWRRSLNAAAGFYRLQANWSGSEFWSAAASAYEGAAHQAAIRIEGEGQFEMRPVLNGERIELRRVWVSPEWPRGVWKVAGRSLEHAAAGQVPLILRRAAGAASHEV